MFRCGTVPLNTRFQAGHPLADIGVPYAMLLYERFLGRPFAGHRDSVSELVSDILETAIEELLTRHGITYQDCRGWSSRWNPS